MTFYKIIRLPITITVGKPGVLTDLDISKICSDNNIPFVLTKCFYLTDLNTIHKRGMHSNNNASELLICIHGSCTIKLFNGKETEIIIMEQHMMVYIPIDIWIEMYNFNDCIIFACVDIRDSTKTTCNDLHTYISNHPA
jgi:hypothetical protein